MKRIVFLLMTFVVAMTAYAQQPYAEMKFDSLEYDFGTFNRNVKTLKHTFTFTSTGTMPVVINQVITTCGCTVATYTKEPVAPGKKGTVDVEYHVSGRFVGPFKKAINIRTNGKKQLVKLHIKGNMVDNS